jgi:lysophospholipase L1-like esterase
MRVRDGNRPALWFLVVLLAASGVAAQTVSGSAFEDRNANGERDDGEPGIVGVAVTLYGTPDAGGSVDWVVETGSDGAYSFAPGDGCYLVSPMDPDGWRLSWTRQARVPDSTPGYLFPVGYPRFSKIDQGVTNLKGGSYRYSAMGDSIAYNFNFCGYPESFWYAKRIRDRLQCAAPAATVTLDQAAVKGEHSDDLLVDDANDLNNVFRIIELQPDLVTVSMIGNDLLDVDPEGSPSQEEINRAVAEVLDARQNLQEALSALASEIPDADIVLNSLYDNLAYNCYTGNTSDFHRTWLPIVNRILRDLAWGQIRRVSVLEAANEFAQEDQVGACTGFDGLICRDFLGFDRIHPTNDGYTVLREKGWEALGGVNLGPMDVPLQRDSQSADFGFLRHLRRLLPTHWETRDGAAVNNPSAALDDDDGGATAGVTLGIGAEEFRLAGFPDWYDEDVIVKAVAGVRYRTSGTVADDFYRVEASIAGQFRPEAGHAYTPTDWNFYTPIVGGGGPDAPSENPDYPSIALLVVPNVPTFREVSATLTKNPTLPPGTADYSWPAVDQNDLATAAMRVASAPVGSTPGNDFYTVEVDAGWVDLYGWSKPRPGEVAGLRASRREDGALAVVFDVLAGAGRYNLYFGRLASMRGGEYDHGSDPPAQPLCDAPTSDAGGGRLEIAVEPTDQPAGDSYFLVTAHVDDVESPSGTRSDGEEVVRSESVCK